MSNGFVLSSRSKIYVYGASSIGKIFLSNNPSLNICGFVDRRALELSSFCSLPVFQISDDSLDLDAVIFVAVKNVFEHDRIVNALCRRGFKKVVYRPVSCDGRKLSKAKAQLNDAYSLLLNGTEMSELPMTVPTLKCPAFFRRPVPALRLGREWVVAQIPIQTLFTDRKGDNPVCVLCLRSHIDFARYALGMPGGSAETYIRYCEESAAKQGLVVTDAWRKNVLDNRCEVFAQMMRRRAADPSFFLRQAPEVEYDPSSQRFYLHSGKHRAAFLAALGDNYVLVKMPVDAYESFCWFAGSEDIFSRHSERFLRGFPPVENPCFYPFSTTREAFFFSLLRAILNVLSSLQPGAGIIDLSVCSCLVDVRDGGFLRRSLVRMGACVYVCSELRDEVEVDLDEFLNQPPLRTGRQLSVLGQARFPRFERV